MVEEKDSDKLINWGFKEELRTDEKIQIEINQATNSDATISFFSDYFLKWKTSEVNIFRQKYLTFHLGL